MRLNLTETDVLHAAHNLIERLAIKGSDRIYGVPRGGVPVALTIAGMTNAIIVSHPANATVIVDDIYDSGATYARVVEPLRHSFRFGALFDKRRPEWAGSWLVMPWETSTEDDDTESAADNIRRLLQYIGEDPLRGGLIETPTRVLNAWREWCSGYNENPADVLKTFEDGAESFNELVVMRNIPVYSHCEHHLAPFFGTATVGYIPNGRIVGLSKLVRLVNIFAHRLQVQERLTSQVAQALDEHLNPLGVGVILQCRHMCMESRGVHSPNTPTLTSALRGALYDDPRARAEFMELRLK